MVAIIDVIVIVLLVTGVGCFVGWGFELASKFMGKTIPNKKSGIAEPPIEELLQPEPIDHFYEQSELEPLTHKKLIEWALFIGYSREEVYQVLTVYARVSLLTAAELIDPEKLARLYFQSGDMTWALNELLIQQRNDLDNKSEPWMEWALGGWTDRPKLVEKGDIL